MDYAFAQKLNDEQRRHATGRDTRCSKAKKDAAMTRKTIDYARLGIEACETFTDGPAAFADFVLETLSLTAPLHVLQTTTTNKLLERLNSFTQFEAKR
jgi:hypothetical protein